MATPPPPPPPNVDGQFLLHLLLHGSSANAPPICTTATTTTTTTTPHHAPSPWHLLDPAVAALGPSHPLPDARPPPLLHSFSDIFHPLPTFPDHYPFLPPPPPLYAPVFSPQDVPWPPHSFPRQRPLPDSLPHDTVPSLSTLQKPSFPPFGCNGVEIDENLRGNHLSQSPANRSPFERASLPQFGCNLVEIDENLRGNHLGQSPSNRSPFERPSMPQIGCNGVEIDENLTGNHLGQSPSNRSPFERPSMLGQEAFRPAFGVSSRSSVENDLGRIGPLMGRDKAFPWNMTQEGLGDVWTPTRPACGLKERDRSSSLDLCQQVVCEPETLYRTKSEGVEPPPARVLEAEGDWSRYGAGTGVQGDEMLTDQRGVYQVNHELESPTLDWEGWNATNNDPAHSANHSTSHEDFHLDASRWNDSENLVKHLDPEDMRGTCTQNKTKYGRQIGQHRLKRRGNNAALRHWVATSREKHDDEDGVGKVEAAGSSEFELPEIASKSNVGFSEAAVPVNSQEGVTPQKPREGPKKRNQQWRLKQPLDANHISPGCMDSGSKPKDFVQKNFRIENPQLFQQDHVGLPSGTNLDSAPASATEASTLYADRGKEAGPAQMESAFYMGKENETAAGLDVGEEEEEEVILGCVGFLDLDNDSEAEERKCSVHKLGGSLTSMDFVSEVIQDDLCREVNPSRQTITRFHKRDVPTRLGMEKWTGQLLSVFQTLIPSEDEELRRKQLLSSLEGIVSKKWPEARLYLFGSCANTFGVCNSDIDVCLSIDGQHTTKPELVLRLADMLQANHMQKVQALTHARVPIVKYSDPTTGISCDVCVNNMLAVVNTKLLHDYAQIDVRLRQLAFIVKHWAKCRQVNETYRGTLSSYAYVLMCIHFLQQRKPAVLPCLQEMEPTYQVTVGNIKCAYYDQVGKLTNFGSRNKETLGELLTSFFEYWAFRHDYSHAVISIRTGGFISKIEKDWTRRIGNERHLICIEDPFEISHDLGRVVDKHSIRFLREEFQRAAKIMRHHSNPCVALFEPYRPGKS